MHNPEGKFITREANGTMLLHLSYTNWFDLMGKAKRACPQEFVDAVKANNMTKVGGVRGGCLVCRAGTS